MRATTFRNLGPATLALLCLARASARATPATAAGVPVLRESGGFGKGIGVEPIGIGVIEVRSPYGSATGIGLRVAVQLDLGPRWALRVPLSLMASVNNVDGLCNSSAFTTFALSPGLVYRARHSVYQRMVGYAGGGLRLSDQITRRDFVGQPLQTADTVNCYKSGNDVVERAAFGPELWAGVEWHPGLTRWMAWDLNLGYSFTSNHGTSIHILWQMIGLRLMF